MVSPIRQISAALALTLPLIAGAQDPAAAPGGLGADAGSPPGQALPMPAYPGPYPFQPPWMRGPGYQPMPLPFGADMSAPPAPPGTPDTGTPDTTGRMMPLPWRGDTAPVPLRIRRQVTPEAYLLRVTPGDGKTADIQVTPRGRALEVSQVSGSETTEERNFDDGRGYMQSFSYSSSSMSRRIPIPPDADLSAMTREEADGTVLIRIPRKSPRGGTEKR